MTESAASKPSGDIVARVDFQYRWRTWALFLFLLGGGLWCLRDGFIVWPEENARWAKLDAKTDRPAKPPHEASGLLFNQGMGILLMIVCIPVAGWRAYRSRGEYRLSGDTLRLPGHPGIPFDQIRSLDLVKWDRKGTAVLEYAVPNGASRRAVLQDMIYDRTPTDQIVERIEAHLEAQEKKHQSETEPSVPPGSTRSGSKLEHP